MKHILLMFLGMLAGCVLLEIVVRVVPIGPHYTALEISSNGRRFITSTNPRIKYRFKPSTQGINEFGLRDPRTVGPKKGFRIITIGDSVTYGWCVESNETLAARLQSLLEDNNENVEVYNAGVPGYEPEQSIEILTDLFSYVLPDLAILVVNPNDVEVSSLELGILQQTAEWKNSLLPSISIARSSLRWSRAASLLLLPRLMEESRKQETMLSTTKTRTEAAFQRLGHFSFENHLPVIVLMFPSYGSSSQAYPNKSTHVYFSDLSLSEGFIFVDLLTAFSKIPDGLKWALACDVIHPNALGYRVAADALLPVLKATINR